VAVRDISELAASMSVTNVFMGNSNEGPGAAPPQLTVDRPRVQQKPPGFLEKTGNGGPAAGTPLPSQDKGFTMAF
jgi:hypothetical protein